MESVFTILLLILVILVYLSNKNNNINRWFAVATFICWLGVFKEAVLFNIIPFIETVWGDNTISVGFIPVYSVMTWALYSLAMPSMIIFALYFSNMDITHPKFMCSTKTIIYIPAILLSFFFPILNFRYYQLNSRAFVIAYSAYNLCLGVAYICLLIRGVRNENPGTAKMQKKHLFWIASSPVIFWLLSSALPYLFRINGLDKLWQWNIVILFICIISFIFLAFRDGFMGLRLISETYNWSSDMNIINKSAEYTSHMLKNQTVKMEWCIENLKEQFDNSGEKTPEELEILSRSISTLKGYMDKMKKHSETISLLEEPHHLRTLIEGALPSCAIPIKINLSHDFFWICDKTHMSEVFANILTNAVEATHDSGTIEVCGEYDKNKRFCLLRFTDHGVGMTKEDVKNMFTPYFTTKNTEKNFGLGLACCKNVVEKHGGNIYAESDIGKGTTITIEIPVKRVEMNEASDKNG